MRIKKNIESMYQKNVVNHAELLLIAEGDKKQYFLIKDCNTFQ